MTTKFALILILLTSFSFKTDSFKTEQQKYPRVRQAYKDTEESVISLLKKNSIEQHKLQIYLRAFKTEKKLELWAKNSTDQNYKLIKEYDICRTSGKLGPKRKQGDFQIPEGYYSINRFNPSSNYFLSLGINYPNKSDKILGVKDNLGGDIFIHGSCVTIGCLPITDDKIKELYVFCVEAKNNGQEKIPVTIFPLKLTADNFNALELKYSSSTEKIELWQDLKLGFDHFNKLKTLPNIVFIDNGRHKISN